MNTSLSGAVPNYYTGTRSELRPFIPENYSRVLEVGCGDGGFRTNLSPQTEVWGIEPVANAAATASKSLHRVIVGDYQQAHNLLPDGYFDLVICNDVIEHMVDDSGFLRTIQSKMCRGGHLIGSIPNMRNWPVLRDLLFKKDWSYQDCGVLDRTHLRFYTERTFPRLLAATGFKVQTFTGINCNVKLRKRIILNTLSLGLLRDTKWVQFAFVARAHAD